MLVLEKMSVGGGNCTVSSGGFVCVDNVKDGLAYMRKTYELSRGECDEELLRIFCEGSLTIKEWISKLDPEAKFRVYGHAGWQHFPGADAIKKWSIYGRKGFTGGDSLFQTFRRIVEDVQKTPVLYNTPAKRLVREGNTVVGVIAEHEGKDMAIRAKRGVVIATGGFQCNPELVRKYVTGSKLAFLGSPGNTGDGLLMAQSMGAQLWHMTDVSAPLGIQVPGVKAGFQLSAKVPSFIWVDQDGSRFVNEKGIDGHTQITAVTFYDAVKHRFPRNPCWMIFDDPACKAGPIYGSAVSGYALNREHYKWSEDNSEEIKKGVIVKADTIEALAEKLKMPKLVETVKKWNDDMKAGGDSVFGRRIMKDPNAKVVFEGRDQDLLSAPGSASVLNARTTAAPPSSRLPCCTIGKVRPTSASARAASLPARSPKTSAARGMSTASAATSTPPNSSTSGLNSNAATAGKLTPTTALRSACATPGKVRLPLRHKASCL